MTLVYPARPTFYIGAQHHPINRRHKPKVQPVRKKRYEHPRHTEARTTYNMVTAVARFLDARTEADLHNRVDNAECINLLSTNSIDVRWPNIDLEMPTLADDLRTLRSKWVEEN